MGFFDDLKEIANRLPREETLRALIRQAPKLEHLPSEETLRGLVGISDQLRDMPKDATLKDLLKIAPQLSHLPSEATLLEGLAWLDRLKPYLDQVSPDEFRRLVERALAMDQLLAVLKEP